MEKLHFWKKHLLISLVIIVYFISIIIKFEFLESLAMIVLLISSISDIETRTIPNICPIILILLSIINPPYNIKNIDILIVFIFIILTLLSLEEKHLGLGDIKILFSLYILIGIKMLLNVLFLSSVFLFFNSIYYIIAKKRNSIAFAPYIFIAYSYVRLL